MENWKTYKVEDLTKEKVLIVGDGYRAKNSELSKNGLPFARGANINQGFLFDGAECLDISNLQKAGDKISRIGDVVFTSKGTVGRFAFVRENTKKFVYSPQLCYWRILNSEFIHPCYLYFWVHSKEFFEQYNGVKNQTDMADYVSLINQRRFHITLPPIEQQRRIAKILSSLDDKIELNRRMNATLEAMAKALFKAWFVDFEPIRANLENRPSESASPVIAKLFPNEFNGDLPKGWRIGTLSEISLNHRQNVNPNEIETETAYVGLEHIPRKSIALTGWGKSEKAESIKSCFRANDILFGKLRPYFHKVVVAPIDGICSTDILVIRPKEAHYFGQILIEFSSDEVIKYANQLSNGAKMPRTSWSDLAKFEIIIPTKQISEEFSKFTISIAEKIKLNIKENQKLAQIRDSLLPRLISGKIRVGEVEKEISQTIQI